MNAEMEKKLEDVSVHIHRINREKDFRENLEEALETFNLSSVIRSHSVVVIKINLCDRVPKRGVITSSTLLYNTISLLRDIARDVKVVESDGLQYSADDAIKATGLLDVIEKAGGTFVNLSHDDYVAMRLKGTLHIRKYNMPKTLDESDVFITMPVMKTHELTLFTGALKNQFGCYPQRNRVLLHPYLAETIVDINLLLRPKLVIMDAITAIEGNGPARGFPKKMNLIITANNVVACDATALQVMRLDVNRVRHVKLAGDVELGPLSGFEVSGNSISEVSRDFALPNRDVGMMFETIAGSNPLTCKLVYDTMFLKPIVKIGRFIRMRTLKGRTYYL